MAVDAEEGRRRREDNMVEIRKNRREENLQKKRREGLAAAQQPSATPAFDRKVDILSYLSLYVLIFGSIDCGLICLNRFLVEFGGD